MIIKYIFKNKNVYFIIYMDETIPSSPYITYDSYSGEYCGYIPYKITNNNITYELSYEYKRYCPVTKKHIKENKYEFPIEDILTSSYLICRLLELERGNCDNYNPSYTYSWYDNTFEVGICGKDLCKMYDSIENIQSLLKNKINCETDDNFENIKMNIYKSFINEEGNWDTIIIPIQDTPLKKKDRIEYILNYIKTI